MRDFLYLLCSLSLSGGLLTLFVLALHRLLRGKVPQAFLYYLWLLVLIRFLLPVGAEQSLMGKLFDAPDRVEAPSKIPSFTASPSDPHSGEPFDSETPAPAEEMITAKKTPSVDHVLTAIWASGVVLCLAGRLYGYHRFKRCLYQSERPVLTEESRLLECLTGEKAHRPALRRSDQIKSPVLVGVLCPVIWLPRTETNEEELSHILRHELTHFKRYDLLYKWVVFLTACVHWFNPLAWYLVRAVDRDCETSCDEAVVKNLSLKGRIGYGEALLHAAENTLSDRLSTSFQTKKQLMKERIRTVTEKTPDGKGVRCLLVITLAVTVFVGGALGAYAKAETEGPPALVPMEPDLNRNDIPEKIDVTWDADGMRCVLTVTEDDRVIFSEEAYTAHVGWDALFLYRGEYLLRYTPMMFQGYADYRYTLFYLGEDASEVVVLENSVSFDTNFFLPARSFDASAIGTFLSEVNELLSESVPLMNTDDDLTESFTRTGSLYHVPSFLFWEDDFHYDDGLSLGENLSAYRDAMEKIYS